MKGDPEGGKPLGELKMSHEIIHETFIRNFFSNGWNLFAIVFVQDGLYYVQLGHFTNKYKKKETALKMYKEYLEKAKAHRITKEKKMYEVVDEKDLKRFAVITFEDTIFWDSDDVLECQKIFKTWEGEMKGIYDYERNMYLDEADIIDLVGCQMHSED